MGLCDARHQFYCAGFPKLKGLRIDGGVRDDLGEKPNKVQTDFGIEWNAGGGH